MLDAAAPEAPAVLAPYVATPPEVVERMLDLAGVGSGDIVVDLGCGDGRIAIAAARRGAAARGCDLEGHWIATARAAAAAAGVGDRCTFEPGDALAADVSDATVVCLYLVEWSTRKVGAKLAAELPRGARVVSHSFRPSAAAPDGESRWSDEAGREHVVRLWTAGGSLAASAPNGAVASPAGEKRRGPFEVHDLALDLFRPYVGETFTFSRDPFEFRVELAEASPLAAETTPPGAFRAPFRVVFHGPPSPVAAQGIAKLANPEFGAIEIFLVPLGPVGPERSATPALPGAIQAMQYEAVFT